MRQHVLVVLVIQLVGRHDVLHDGGVVAGAGARRALAPQRRGKGRADVRRNGEAVGDKGRAVGPADGVRAREHDHVLDAEALGGEVPHELGEVEGRRREEVEGARGIGDAPVEAACGHVEVDPAAAEEEGGVAGGEGDDVRAGDDARARPLDRGLGDVDDLEAPEAGVVGRAELLWLRVGRRRVQQDGGVAALRIISWRCIGHGPRGVASVCAIHLMQEQCV